MLIDTAAWPVGSATAVLAGVLLWPVGGRLALRPASRAAAVALYSAVALSIDLRVPSGVDGTAALLLAVAACLAVGGPVRNAAAVAACALAVAAAPVAAVGFLVLLGAMACDGSLAGRWPLTGRRAAGVAALVLAAGVAVTVLRPDLPQLLPAVALGLLTLWSVLVTGLLWPRLRWLRPVGLAVLALLSCVWIPGPDGDAVVIVAAVVAVLTVVLAEEFGTLLARRALVATAAAAVATTALLAPVGAPSRTAHTAPVAAGLVRREVSIAAVRPLTITIPALGVNGPLGQLTVDPATGELVAPDDAATAGWFGGGIAPGEVGPAVVGGHVDSRAGPGVFFDLHRMRPGDMIEIMRSDRRIVRFTVTTVALYPKDRFPTAAVYGPTAGPELRLITCGGPFDRAARSYEDNVIVEAVLV